MLIGLSINNVVLIDSLHLSMHKGFTALTGETGAGKSILLDALSLALGAKADLNCIRANTDMAVVTATFSLSDFSNIHPIFEMMETHALNVEGDPKNSHLILKRSVHRTQKSRAFINDQPVSLALLKQFGDALVDVHGQHDHLLDESLHKILIDDFARAQKTTQSLDDLLAITKDRFVVWHTAKQALLAFDADLEKHRADQDFYNQVLKDLKPLKLEVGMEESLIERRQSLQGLGKIISAVEDILKAIEFPNPLASILYGYQKNLERLDDGGFAPLSRASAALERAGIEIAEVQAELKTLFDTNRTAAQDLDLIDEELHQIRSFARKYHVTCDGLVDLKEQALKAALSEDDLSEKRSVLRKNLDDALKAYGEHEENLFVFRSNAARELESRVGLELPDLKLERAVFEVRITRSEKPSADGGQGASFWVSMNTGQTPAPLVKAASGGEMARLMLALKMIVAKTTAMPTLIFDEIDTGVGGAVANAIGRKLHDLGAFVQVLSITHSPQVAASSNHHWRIFKAEKNGLTTTHVVPLKEEERIDEIARMLSGASITEEARLAAKALIAERV